MNAGANLILCVYDQRAAALLVALASQQIAELDLSTLPAAAALNVSHRALAARYAGCAIRLLTGFSGREMRVCRELSLRVNTRPHCTYVLRLKRERRL